MKVAFGPYLRQKREDAKLSQGELARQAGVTRRQVGRWEAGEAIPERPQRILLARILGVDLLEAICREEADLAEGAA